MTSHGVAFEQLTTALDWAFLTEAPHHADRVRGAEEGGVVVRTALIDEGYGAKSRAPSRLHQFWGGNAESILRDKIEDGGGRVGAAAWNDGLAQYNSSTLRFCNVEHQYL